jgi:hypothetical protein
VPTFSTAGAQQNRAAHTHVRRDTSHSRIHAPPRLLFEKLITVSGIGPSWRRSERYGRRRNGGGDSPQRRNPTPRVPGIGEG